MSDGSKIYLADCKDPMDEYHELIGIVDRLREAGNWIDTQGVTKTPASGAVCQDGYHYGGPVDKPHRLKRVPRI